MPAERIQELQAEIKAIKWEIDSFELDPDDFTDQYDDMLDECHGEFMGMNAAYILKECDETAYRCGLLDYVDGIDKEECQEYKDLVEALEELKTELSEF